MGGASAPPSTIARKRYPIYDAFSDRVGWIYEDLRMIDNRGRFIRCDREYRGQLLAACQMLDLITPGGKK